MDPAEQVEIQVPRSLHAAVMAKLSLLGAFVQELSYWRPRCSWARRCLLRESRF